MRKDGDEWGADRLRREIEVAKSAELLGTMTTATCVPVQEVLQHCQLVVQAGFVLPVRLLAVIASMCGRQLLGTTKFGDLVELLKPWGDGGKLELNEAEGLKDDGNVRWGSSLTQQQHKKQGPT